MIFEIWQPCYSEHGMEGEIGKAHFWGYSDGNTFLDACIKLFKESEVNEEGTHLFILGSVIYAHLKKRLGVNIMNMQLLIIF
jgi:hypothetical protein